MTAEFSKGCLAEAMEILEACAEARRIYGELDPYAMSEAFGKDRSIDDNMLMAALRTEAAVGRMLKHTTADSRERCIRRILNGGHWQTVVALIQVLPKYERERVVA